jgi:hypothetical protein
MDMGQLGNHFWLPAAMLTLSAIAAMNSALAAAPGNHPRAAAAPHADYHAPLDLRPSTSPIASAEKSTANFPSARRPAMGDERRIDLPALGSEGTQTRIPSRAEEFARRVHREGLPVARLWENKSALLSLGLNKRGKPGLWIVQKIR